MSVDSLGVFVAGLMLVAFMIEALVETIQKIQEDPFKPVVAFVLGGGMSWYLGVNLFNYVGVVPAVSIPWVSQVVNAVLMGILVSRYSGEINALLEILKGFKVDAQSRM